MHFNGDDDDVTHVVYCYTFSLTSITFSLSCTVEELPAKSMGTVVLPQLTDDLKKDIMERIASKSLMDIHVALAPAVSYG